MLVWDGRVTTLWACASGKTRPAAANRSRVGVETSRLPANPRASARRVSTVISTRSAPRRASTLPARAADGGWRPPPGAVGRGLEGLDGAPTTTPSTTATASGGPRRANHLLGGGAAAPRRPAAPRLTGSSGSPALLWRTYFSGRSRSAS